MVVAAAAAVVLLPTRSMASGDGILLAAMSSRVSWDESVGADSSAAAEVTAVVATGHASSSSETGDEKEVRARRPSRYWRTWLGRWGDCGG